MHNAHLISTATFLWQNFSPLFWGILRRGIKKLPWAFSFNIADRCPIGCSCYWRAQARVQELDDDAVVQFFRDKRRDGYVHANLVGGEPYVRPALLKKLEGIIPFNWIITSGTTPLVRLRSTTHFVSIDGATPDTHDRVRRSKGLWARIIKHITHARAGGDFPLFIHTTLNAINYQEIGAIVDTWRKNGLADGVVVSTLTPIAGAGDETFRLSREQRMWIVEELLRLKQSHGDFLCMTEAMICRLHPSHTIKLRPHLCSTAQLIESYDAAGKRMAQCILSEKADCKECGCIITTMSDNTRPSTMTDLLESIATWARLSTLR